MSLVLRTTPSPRGDVAFDYAVWSGLRFRGPAAHAPDRPHVVLIDIDTLRPDRMGCYGYQRKTTPRIDRWAGERSVVFLDALAPSSWTPPSTASMITGLAPHQHLMEDHDSSLANSTLTLAGRLRAAGYETYSYVDGAFFQRAFGLDQGFDINDTRGGEQRWAEPLDIIRRRRSERPLFLFLQTYRVHAPYRFDPRFLDSIPLDHGRLSGESVGYENCIYQYLAGELELTEVDKSYVNALYDAGVARMDDVVGGFLEELETVLEGRPALVFLTADHGEEFWEHNRMGHGHSLHGELLRVPFLIRFPEPRTDRPAVSRDPVSLLDIVPTVLDYAGLEAPAMLPGRSLREPMPSPRLRAAQLRGQGHHAIQFGAWKLIRGAFEDPRWRPDSVELFHLATDPSELDNLAASEPGRVEELDRRWQEYLRNHPVQTEASAAGEVGPEELRSLRALGYLR